MAGTAEQLPCWHCCLLGNLGLTQAQEELLVPGELPWEAQATTQCDQKDAQALSAPEGIQHLLPAGVTGGDPLQG